MRLRKFILTLTVGLATVCFGLHNIDLAGEGEALSEMLESDV